MTASMPVEDLWAGLLAAVRIGSLFMVAPVFSHRAVPRRIRAACAILVSVVCAPALVGVPPPDATVAVAASVVREVAIGATLGFALRLVFAGFGLVGEFMSIQGGLGAATVLDPASGSSSVVLSSLIQFYALVMFLAVDGHHTVLRALVHSFEALPPGTAELSSVVFGAVSAFGGTLYEVGVRLAAPVTAVMLVSNVAVGTLGRVIPQLNLMALQLPAHIAVTLAVLTLGTNSFAGAVAETLTALTDGAVATVLGGEG